jgi:Tol biopolymer transport system component
LLFGARSEQSSLEVVSFDPVREALVGTPTTVLRLARPIAGLDWSPDGKALVLGVPAGSREDICVVQADGSGYRQLTDAPFLHRLPRWSADGSRIAFASNRGGTLQIWTIRSDGSGLTQVTDEPRGTMTPVFSPDGTRLAATRSGGLPGDTVVVKLTPGYPLERHLPQIPGDRVFVSYSWSRDGQILAGSTIRYAEDQAVLLYSFATNSIREVTKGRAPLFLSDGRRLVFQNLRGGLDLLDTVSGRIKPLLPDGTVRGQLGGLNASITADDRKIAYVETNREGDVWLMHLGGAAPAGTPAPPP